MKSSGVLVGAVAGVTAGAGVAFYFDPISGSRRRAQLKQKTTRAGKQTFRMVDKGWRDASNRTVGAYFRVKSKLRRELVDDETLLERVRARLGHACSHPGAVDITVREGIVTLRGPILAAEDETLFNEILKVRGIKGIDDQLAIHDSPAHISSLQGGGSERVTGQRRAQWPPAWRLGADMAGVGLLGAGLWRRGLVGLALNGAAAALLLRSYTNRRLGHFFGRNATGTTMEVERSIHIDAPVDVVFDYFRQLENFPQFTQHVREVIRVGDDRWHWILEGPKGKTFEWDAVISRFVENDRIEWGSAPGAEIENAGCVRFIGDRNGGTQLTLRFVYGPPPGPFGSAFFALLGPDPGRLIGQDLCQLKAAVERLGEARANFGEDAAQFAPPSPS